MTSTTQSALSTRPPIIVVLGHVDHGKTSLLDYLRKSSVVKREKGGITQSIGASVVHTENGKELTFIDTPGHAAFSQMRGRGAKVADIAILVVAGDDGIKPQTREALEIILAEKIPYIVAVTKIDLATASLPTVQAQLEGEGVLFEGRGGDVPCIGVSSHTGAGISDLLDVINLLAELKEISGDPHAPLEAVVIETSKDKAGPKMSVVVRNGTLVVGDDIVSETVEGRIRALINDAGQSVKSIVPGYPASVLGLPSLPPVGSKIWQKKHGATVAIAEAQNKQADIVDSEGKLTLLIKAHNEGTREAIIGSLPSENVFVISSGVGDVSESDIFLAKSSGAKIFTFETKIPSTVLALAKTEGVQIESFGIIYELVNRVQELLDGEKDEILGKADILASFPFDNRLVAGCKVSSGKLSKGDVARVIRGENIIGDVKIISIRRGKNDITEAKQGEECGVIFVPQLAFSVGDVILSVRKR